jgi:predicted nucleotide-binding protein
MAAKRREEPPAELKIARADAAQKISERIQKGKALLEIEVQTWDQFKAAQEEYYKWTAYNTELLTRIFSNDTLASEYSFWGIACGTPEYLPKAVGELHEDIRSRIHRLESILERLELIEEPNAISSASRDVRLVAVGKKVFIVHGRDEAAEEAVARFISQMGLSPVILHEEPNKGRTIIEKFEQHADVSFAVVLLTADDVGAEKSVPDSLRPRPRQNVVFELGYFVGKLGRGKVCALRDEISDMELLSDYHGVLFVTRDGPGAWRLQLARELKAAGFEVDLNKCM